jgi:hypothetical protein
VLRRVLPLLVAVGLLATWARQPCLPEGDAPPFWRNGRHVPAVIDREARADVLPAERSEGTGPRREGGEAPLGAARPPRWGIAAVHCGPNGLVDEARLEDALLAQLHLRVNGAANAHGARA